MAHLYKRRKQFWICYYVNGRKIQKSLNTDNERIATDSLYAGFPNATIIGTDLK